MKSFFNSLFVWLETMGRVRAASYFARTGNYQAAKKIMSE
jgi:hypothetical protein